MLNNIKIGTRLMLLVGLLNLFLLAVGWIGLHGMAGTDAAIDTIYEDRVVPLRDLKVIADMYAVNIVDTTHKARAGTVSLAEALHNIDQAAKTIKETWSRYLATTLVEEERKLIGQIEPLMAAADLDVTRLRQILQSGQRAQLDEFAAKTLYPAIDPVSGKFSDLIELQLTVAKQEYDQSQARYAKDSLITISLIVAALVLGIGIGIAIIRSITGPLHHVGTVLRRMAAGDLEVDLSDDGRKDEMGEMIRAAAHITATIKAVAQDLRQLIEAAKAGSLSTRVDASQHEGEFGVLVQGVNDLVELLTAPLFEVAAVMAHLASGDVRGRITGAYDGDLRALKGNVNRSLDALVTLLDEISAFAGALAAGDVTQTINGSYQGDFASIKLNLNQAVAQFRGVIEAVAQSTGQVALSAGETTAAAVDVSRQAASQMLTLAEVSSAIEQTVAAIAEIARSAERGSTLARTTADRAEGGQAKLNHLVSAVDSISAGNLKITQISSLISGIADKTYVLALNAGLEAVRAGEQGRGFGLIARQITKLAEDVGQATREIRTVVEEAGRSVAAGNAAAGEAGAAIVEIVTSARESGTTAQAIAAAIDEQNAMARVLQDRVGQLHMVGQSTAGAAEEISATMNGLAEMAQQLKREADRIKVA